MSKKGGTDTTLYVIFILIATILILAILYAILQTKITGGIFKGL